MAAEHPIHHNQPPILQDGMIPDYVPFFPVHFSASARTSPWTDKELGLDGDSSSAPTANPSFAALRKGFQPALGDVTNPLKVVRQVTCLPNRAVSLIAQFLHEERVVQSSSSTSLENANPQAQTEVELQLVEGERALTIYASVFQVLVLLAFNERAELAFVELQQQLRAPPSVLDSYLRSLTSEECPVLLRQEGDGPAFTTYTLNDAFLTECARGVDKPLQVPEATLPRAAARKPTRTGLIQTALLQIAVQDAALPDRVEMARLYQLTCERLPFKLSEQEFRTVVTRVSDAGFFHIEDDGNVVQIR